jgi:hypothetical protein
MDIGKDMALLSTGKDVFSSSPSSWILEQGASFVNSGIGGHSFRNSHLAHPLGPSDNPWPDI